MTSWLVPEVSPNLEPVALSSPICGKLNGERLMVSGVYSTPRKKLSSNLRRDP